MLQHKQAILLISLFLYLGYSGLTRAHAVITNTTLGKNSIAPGQARQIKINFNVKVETALSRVFLVSKGDQQTLLLISSSAPGQILVNIPALSPGEYALRFKIFGGDGHLTEDLLHFQVQ